MTRTIEVEVKTERKYDFKGRVARQYGARGRVQALQAAEDLAWGRISYETASSIFFECQVVEVEIEERATGKIIRWVRDLDFRF